MSIDHQIAEEVDRRLAANEYIGTDLAWNDLLVDLRNRPHTDELIDILVQQGNIDALHRRLVDALVRATRDGQGKENEESTQYLLLTLLKFDIWKRVEQSNQELAEGLEAYYENTMMHLAHKPGIISATMRRIITLVHRCIVGNNDHYKV